MWKHAIKIFVLSLSIVLVFVFDLSRKQNEYILNLIMLYEKCIFGTQFHVLNVRRCDFSHLKWFFVQIHGVRIVRV